MKILNQLKLNYFLVSNIYEEFNSLNWKQRFEHRGKIPVAFCADKFPITKLGVVGMRQKTDAKQVKRKLINLFITFLQFIKYIEFSYDMADGRDWAQLKLIELLRPEFLSMTKSFPETLFDCIWKWFALNLFKALKLKVWRLIC